MKLYIIIVTLVISVKVLEENIEGHCPQKSRRLVGGNAETHFGVFSRPQNASFCAYMLMF